MKKRCLSHLAFALCLATLPLAAAPGDISTIAGTATLGFSGDGAAATAAQLSAPESVAIDSAGNLFIADRDNHRIRRIDAVTGFIETVAGTGTAGFSGDGGPATSAQFDTPNGIAVATNGDLYIGDHRNHRIRRIDGTTGTITTIAGTGVLGFSGDGGEATSAQLHFPSTVSLDANQGLIVTDYWNHRIRRIDLVSGIIETVAGSETRGFDGDGGPATDAHLDLPTFAIADRAGNLFIADWANQRIRRVDAVTGVIETIAGTGTSATSGDGGPAVTAGVFRPWGLALDAAGNLFFCEQLGHRIRRIDAVTGFITTVAGTGTSGFSGDGGQAASASVWMPLGIAVSPGGDLIFGDLFNQRIRRIEAIAAAATRATDATIGATTALFIGRDIVNADGSGQQLTFTSKRGRPVSFHARFHNDSSRGELHAYDDGEATNDDLALRVSGGNRFFQSSYFIGGGNVTAAIVAGTLVAEEVPRAGEVTLSARLKPKVKRGTKRMLVDIRVTSLGDASKTDQVAATISAKAKRSSKP